tara:strand:- start:327 stop:446 length:120 start_codon:yes stop_codon:yes gene_type:complete
MSDEELIERLKYLVFDLSLNNEELLDAITNLINFNKNDK